MGAVPSQEEFRATATQLVRDFPEVRRLADRGPVQITSHGRTELVMLSPSHFAQIAEVGAVDGIRTEGKLGTILDTIDTAVLIFDDDLRVRRANPALCALVDADERQLIGLPAAALVSHPSHRYTIERLAEVHRSGHAEVLTAASARDFTRTLHIQLKPWPNGVALFADDITDRMRFADLQIANTMMDRSLAALGGVGSALVRSCGTILAGSGGLAQMAGVAQKALVGARLQSLLSPQSRTSAGEAILDSSGEPRRYELEYLRKGVTAAPAIMVVTSYWTAEHHACAAVSLHDANWQAD